MRQPPDTPAVLRAACEPDAASARGVHGVIMKSTTPPKHESTYMDRGLTPPELARLLRVSPDRVRAWIARGELGAINTADNRSGRPRYVVLPHHLAEGEQRRRVVVAAPTPRRRRRAAETVDYY